MMDNPAETGILSPDPFSHPYEVNSNEKVYSEGTTGKAETGGEMEKTTSGETRDAVGGVVEEDSFRSAGIDGKVATDAGNGLGDGEGHGDVHDDGHGDEDVLMADVDVEDGYVGGAGDVQEECIGNGGLDQAQPAVVENGKQNGRRCGKWIYFT